MADESDNLGPLIQDLAKYGVGAAGTVGANAATQSAYEAVLKNLRDRFSDYEHLSPAGYTPITPQSLGPSALTQIAPDAQSRADEQAAIAQLDNIAKSGGLTLADKQALNELEQQLSRGTGARNASLANQFAARGQLGSGQQLAMSLDANQNAAQNANQRGESIAAQAQARAMDAVLRKAGASRNMANDDYARKQRAAEATDSIAKYNASMSTDAGKYNNLIKGQSFDDSLSKLRGETGLTNSMNGALLGSGQQNANTAAGLAYGGAGLVNTLGGAAKNLSRLGSGGTGGGSSGGDTNPDATGDRGGAADLGNGTSGGKDLGVEDQPVDQTLQGSDPNDWNQYP